MILHIAGIPLRYRDENGEHPRRAAGVECEGKARASVAGQCDDGRSVGVPCGVRRINTIGEKQDSPPAHATLAR
jgi:hypothetical protein